MQLVQDNVSKVLKQMDPLRIMRQDRRVQHVGISENDPGLQTNLPALVGRSIPIVGLDSNRGSYGRDQLSELGQLILGQSLGRKQV